MLDLLKGNNIEENLKQMREVIKLTLADEKDLIANLSNISAIINLYLDDINWVGFYIKKEDELVLGPFQGKPACIRIKNGKGVCGTASNEKRIVIVDDVHDFPGHIACDSDSNSEIVLPLYQKNEVFGVLDIDSPKFSRFTTLEKKYLELISEDITKFLN